MRSILPVVLALVVAGLIIVVMGSNPLDFYAGVWKYGLTGNNWQDSLRLMAPLMIIALGLIVAFRGQLWNLGYNGTFLLGSVVASGLGPNLFPVLPGWLVTAIIILGSLLVGALWSVVPAVLKARFGTNEIITSLVMSFIAIGVVNLLIKGPVHDPNPRVTAPQTATIARENLLPFIDGTRVHIGFVVAIVLALVAQFIVSRTSFGVRLDVFGASPKAAQHVGISRSWMIILLFCTSGALIALAGSIDVLGNVTYQRANWNPGYGDAVMPFVFLARLSPLAAIPLVAFYSVFANGGINAARSVGLNSDFLLVVVGLILVFMTITEFVGEKRRLGQGYLPAGMKQSVMALFGPRAAAPVKVTTPAPDKVTTSSSPTTTTTSTPGKVTT
ncbi:putative B6 ABC transporter permease subunit 2 [Naasia aerilata]|uniref:ABC transporter permease n=1 Tax=Naasia aerilata TaxID=1162966 RepID=A0ABN6XSQ7_9MICO|nr:ABC transporter permease [Naasia aerilata]BDZ47193.1 ABC transporter permease [Naasia aerilata]